MPTSDPNTLYELTKAIGENNTETKQLNLSLHDLNSRLYETNKQLKEFSEEIKDKLENHEIRIVDVEHNCRRTADWTRAWNRIELLEQAEYKRAGSSQWENRIINIVQAVIVAAVVAIVLFFMKGGAIL